MSKSSKARYGVFGVVVLAVIAGLAIASLKLRASTSAQFPTVRVLRGDVDLRVYTYGELRPVRSAMLMAPPVSGTLQIIKLWNPAVPAKPGDVIVEFDPSEQEFKLEQARFDLADADENIAKSNADAAVQGAQDKVALLSAQFDVRRAELEVSRNELLSAIDARKNDLALQEARRRLAQLQQDIKSHESSNRAALAVLQEKRAKANLDIQQAQRSIANMQVKAPFGGMASLQTNLDAAQIYYPGMVLPDYREGDVVRPGRSIVEVLEGQMEVQSRVAESDRANIAQGQPIEIHVDALPTVPLNGKVKAVASLASRGMFWGDNTRAFDTTFEVHGSDPRLKPAESVQVVISTAPLRNVLYVPTQAVFQKNGKPVVYVRSHSVFEPRDIKIVRRGEARVVLEGIAEGTEVALVNPEQQRTNGSKAGTGPSLGGAK
jgi:HlyD family secretion protein